MRDKGKLKYYKTHCFTEIQSFILNKSFQDCYKPLANLQLILTVLSLFSVLLQRKSLEVLILLLTGIGSLSFFSSIDSSIITFFSSKSFFGETRSFFIWYGFCWLHPCGFHLTCSSVPAFPVNPRVGCVITFTFDLFLQDCFIGAVLFHREVLSVVSFLLFHDFSSHWKIIS